MDGHLEGLTNDELNAGQAAPPVIEFDAEGNVVNAWGDANLLPKDLHGCAIDREGHVWLDGSEDGIVQEYSHDGRELLLQIGKRGVFDSSDGTVMGAPLNSSPSQFFRVSESDSIHIMETFMSPTGMRKDAAAIIFASWCLIRVGITCASGNCRDRLTKRVAATTVHPFRSTIGIRTIRHHCSPTMLRAPRFVRRSLQFPLAQVMPTLIKHHDAKIIAAASFRMPVGDINVSIMWIESDFRHAEELRRA